MSENNSEQTINIAVTIDGVPTPVVETPTPIDLSNKKGLWVIFTGNGKGKTSAAVGVAIRASGYKRKVLFLQFIKKWPTGEKLALEGDPDITFMQMGEGFVGIWGDNKPRETHENAAQEAWAYAKYAIQSHAYDVIILDELNVALHEKLLNLSDVLPVLVGRPNDIDLITTGRWSPLEFEEHADTITEFVEKKHPFNNGILAKKSIDF